MKINLDNKNIQRIPSEEFDICSLCYFRKHNIDCFEDIYHCLHGCFITSSYYGESNTDDTLFKL